MLVKLTRFDDVAIAVNPVQVKFWEPANDGSGGTHLVFGADLGRVVKETPEMVEALLGAAKPE